MTAFSRLSVALAVAAWATGTLAYYECDVKEVKGCYKDNYPPFVKGQGRRILPHCAKFATNPTQGAFSLEACASLCADDGFTSAAALAGVEYGEQCYCGNGFASGVPVTTSPNCTFKCTSNQRESCGGADAITVVAYNCTEHPGPAPAPPPPPPPPPPVKPAVPAYHGCVNASATTLPFCDASRSHEERIEDLLGRLNLTEKIALLSPTVNPYCAVNTPPIQRLGLPRYKWLTEVNSCVDTGCLGQYKCPTTFIGPTGMAASFNRTSWYLKGDVVSTDLRVTNNYGDSSKINQVGLTGYGPNINMVKDPRYGRNSELAGEDPFLSGTYAQHYVQGMQQRSTEGHLKMIAYLKHYTAYSVETSRFTFVANVSMFDLWDSNLRQYEIAFTKGNASGAMCSYFAPNGVSCCGNSYLLNDVIRGKWGKTDAVVMSDCSAVANMVKNHYASGPIDASAKAINGGLDVYGGWTDDLWTQGYLADAVHQGLVNESTVTEAVRRTFNHKLEAGLFDPVESQAWTKLTVDDLNTTQAQQVAYEAALQGMVLLKNDNGALPLKVGTSVAVVGPLADTASLYNSDYAGAGMPSDQVGIGSAIALANKGGATLIAPGIDVSSQKTAGIPAALAAVDGADAVVLVVGIDKSQEHEGMDRSDTLLPGLQYNFSQQIFQAAGKKPVILVTISGGMVSIDTMIGQSSAIVDAFNPAQKGPLALADLLFGTENRWGKLPITIYNSTYTSAFKIQDMSFHTPPGRSYRYYSGKPLFEFGSGLSYTTFTHTCTGGGGSNVPMNFTCAVKNTGAVRGDEVVMVYHAAGSGIRGSADHPVPVRALVEFDRVLLAPGEEATLSFQLEQDAFALTNNDGERVVYRGQRDVIFSRGNGADQAISVTL